METKEQTRLAGIIGNQYGDLTLLHLTSDVYGKGEASKKDKYTVFGVFKCKCGRKRIININTIIYASEDSKQLKCIHKVMNGHSYYGLEESYVLRFRAVYTRISKSDIGSEWDNLSDFYDDMFLKYYATINEAMRHNLKVVRFDRYDQNKPYSSDNLYWYYGSKIKQDTTDYDLVIDNKEFGSLYEVANVYNMDISTLYRRYKKGIRGNDLVS